MRAISTALLLIGCAGERQDPDVERFHRAVLRGDLAAVERMLVARPKLVGARDEEGMTALHFAAARLRVAPSAVDGSAASERRESPGDVACGTAPIVTAYDRDDLLRHVANRARKEEGERGGRAAPSGDDAGAHLSFTTTLDQRTMAELLIRHGGKVNARTRSRAYTPLHLAVRMGHKGVAEALLAHGADADTADAVGLTALGMAAQSGNTALARVLLEHGVPVDGRMKSGILPVFEKDTPLALATLCKQRGMVDLLLERGADPNLRIRDDFAPLHLADTLEIAEALIAHGAALEGRGHEGRTPLHQAAMQHRLPLVQLFLGRGADPNARDAKGQTPLMLALLQGYDTTEVVAWLLGHGARADVRDASGQPALHAARNRASILLLLDAGASVDTPDRYGRTPLHRAVENEDVPLVEALLARGAKVDVTDSTGHTPLYYTWGDSERDQRVAALLRRAGAK